MVDAGLGVGQQEADEDAISGVVVSRLCQCSIGPGELDQGVAVVEQNAVEPPLPP